MSIEYLNGNELTKYPFDDGCSLTSSSSVLIPNDFFADIYFIGPPGLNRYYEVSQINLSIADNIIISFLGYQPNGTLAPEGAVTATILISDIVAHGLIARTAGFRMVKIVFGTGALNFINTHIGANLTFPVGAMRLSLAATGLSTTVVNNIRIYNESDLITELQNQEAIFKEGFNLGITGNTSNATMEVIPGGGAGLYDACAGDSSIKTINFTPPDINGNFLIFGDGCYTLRKGYNGEEDHGLTLQNQCSPKCTADQLSAFAHYLNRVKDGIRDLSVLIVDLSDELKDRIENAPEKNIPYLKTAFARFGGNDKYYYSVVVGFFNPTSEALPVSAELTYPIELEYIPKGSRFKTKNITEDVPTPGLAGKECPCLSVARYEFVLSFDGEPDEEIELEIEASIGDVTQTFTLLLEE